MSTTNTITLPEDVFHDVLQRADEVGASPQEWVTQVLAERFRLQRQTDAFFKERAARASGRSLRELLDNAPDNSPDPGDELE